MIIPLPLPGEFYQGHIGRIGCLNGFTSVDHTIDGILGIASENRVPSRHPSVIDWLSQQCDIVPETYARQHTLLSYFAFTDHDASTWQRRGNEQSAFNVGTLPPRLCHKCVEEDLRRHIYSHWRLRHQLPGMYWCVEHDNLLNATFNENGYFSMPHQLLNDSIMLTTSQGDRYSGVSDIIIRFHKAVELMAWEGLQISREKLKHTLWLHLDTISAQDQSLKKLNKTTYLSELFMEMLPIDWLASIVPSLHLKRRRQAFYPIDAVIVESSVYRPNSAVIAMFLAMFFDTPIDGLNYIKSSLQRSSKNIIIS